MAKVISRKTLLRRGILSFLAHKFFDKFIFVVIMDISVVQNVENIERPKLKVVLVKPLEENPNLALSTTPNNIVYLEDVGSYLCSKCETIGSEFMNIDMEIVFNHDMTIKLEYEHLKDLYLVRYHFYREHWRVDLDYIKQNS